MALTIYMALITFHTYVPGPKTTNFVAVRRQSVQPWPRTTCRQQCGQTEPGVGGKPVR